MFSSWYHRFTLHTDASSVRAEAVLMLVIDGKEFTISFASHRSQRRTRLGYQQREGMVVLYAVGNYWQCLAG